MDGYKARLLRCGDFMANEQNLKPIRSKSQARELQKKSAQARSKNVAEKKLIKDRILERMGEDDWDAFIDGIIERAIESTSGAEFLRDTIGQKPIDKIQVTEIDQNIIDEVEAMVFEDDEERSSSVSEE